MKFSAYIHAFTLDRSRENAFTVTGLKAERLERVKSDYIFFFQ